MTQSFSDVSSRRRPKARQWTNASGGDNTKESENCGFVDLSESPEAKRLKVSSIGKINEPTEAVIDIPDSSDSEVDTDISLRDRLLQKKMVDISTDNVNQPEKEAIASTHDTSIISINTNSDDEAPELLNLTTASVNTNISPRLHQEVIDIDDHEEHNVTLSPKSPILSPPRWPRSNSIGPALEENVLRNVQIDLPPLVPLTTISCQQSVPRPTKSPSKARRTKHQLQVHLEKSLFDSTLGEKIYEGLTTFTHANKPMSFSCSSQTGIAVPQSIVWSAVYPDKTIVPPVACAYIPAPDFLQALETQYELIYDRILKLRQRVQDDYARIFLLVEGVEKALIERQRLQQRGNGNTTCVTFADVHNAVVHLFINSFCHIHFTSLPEDSASYIISLTREISQLPTLTPSNILTHTVRLTSLRVTRNGGNIIITMSFLDNKLDTSNEYSNAWLRMLQMIPGVSEAIAQRIVDYYPTIDSLMQVYTNPSIPNDVKQIILAEKLRANSIEIVLSKRIYNVFTSTNPNTLL
ncbi:hypothetical protein THRCLA_03971 [Thraustotheca clavata]|uniref:ERCC4 domain-containing protein n=1 Tax=Thraustotheca clavata TaxID=74557 RepID=A0A1W0A0C4_9STRA|nr:hypothetical protein THRCLA_03971 [Thraustotheca clavata]